MYDKHTEEQEQAAHRPKPGNEITAKSELVLERLLAAHGSMCRKTLALLAVLSVRSRSSIPSASNTYS